MKTKSFAFRGINLTYYDYESDKPPLLFCHANGYSAGCYKYYHEVLQKDYRVLALDFAGHGKSDFTLDFKNWNFFRDQILSLLDREKINSIQTIGHSLGGASTILASVKEPERFKKLIAFDPVILGWKMITLGKFLKSPLEKGALKRRKTFSSMELVRRSYRKFPAFSKFDDSVFEDYLNSCIKETGNGKEVELCCDPRVEAQIFGDAHYHIFVNFYKVSREVHVLIPEEYEVCSPDLAKLITKKNPSSSVTIWPGITHFFPFENPKQTLDWLQTKLEL